MTVRTVAASVAVVVIVLLVVWLSELSFERAILLASVLVIGLAAVAGLVVFWGRVLADSLRSSRRPRLYLSVGVGFVGLLVVLTLLGVKLPHE
jgi:hypothetical protein